jgi:hypothetical protein
MDGLAERGQSRVEEPLFGLDHIGLDTYVDSDWLKFYIADGAKAIKRLEVFVLQRTRIRYSSEAYRFESIEPAAKQSSCLSGRREPKRSSSGSIDR